jgi:DNA-binding beta-propeller fold protein YncE
LGVYAVTSPIQPCFDGTNIWVINNSNDDVIKLRALDGAIMGTYTVGSNPLDICFDGTYIWVVNCHSHSITRLAITN